MNRVVIRTVLERLDLAHKGDLEISTIDGQTVYIEGWGDIPKLEVNTIEVFTVPKPVEAAIEAAFPDQAYSILSEIREAADHFFFHRWGLYVGVEYDGYIHT